MSDLNEENENRSNRIDDSSLDQYVNKPINNFSVWVQHVLPTVFDDSLSYYELLTKVVKTLNDVINSNNTTINNMSELNNLFITLNNYVDKYFDNLDVQEEINIKLDEMSRNGTLTALILPFFSDLNDKVDNNTSRINNLITLQEGSTTGDAELIDGRVGYNSQIYSNIGTAIRFQIKGVYDDSANYVRRSRTINLLNKDDCIIGKSLNAQGNLTSYSTFAVSNFIPVSQGDKLIPYKKLNRCFYDNDKNPVLPKLYTDTSDDIAPQNGYYRTSLYINSPNLMDLNNAVVYLSTSENDSPKKDIPYYNYELIADINNNLSNEIKEARNSNDTEYPSLKDSIINQCKYVFDESNNYIKRTRTINLLDKNKCILNAFLSENTGLLNASSTFAVSNFIPVSQGDKLIPYKKLNRCFYDSNKNIILIKSYEDTSDDIAPQDGYYRTTLYISRTDHMDLNNAVVYLSTSENDTPKKDIPYYNYELLADVKYKTPHNFTSRIFNKVVCCGDSYASGHINTGINGEYNAQATKFSWVESMKKLTGSNWLNAGKSGANVLTWQTDPLGFAKAQEYGQSQAYIIGLMINDQSNSSRHVDVGSSSDIGSNNETYYAGMTQIINKLLSISPNAKIFVCTCPNNADSYTPYNQAVHDIVNYFRNNQNNTNIHCLDLLENIEKYSNNTILQQDFINGHYTAIGYEIFAEILNDILSDYINNNISEFQNVAFIPYDE